MFNFGVLLEDLGRTRLRARGLSDGHRRRSESRRLSLQSRAAVRIARQAAARDPASRAVPATGHRRDALIGASAYGSVGWHVGLQLSRMEGQLLSRKDATPKMLPYYAEHFATRRDQQHLLPHADREAPRGLERADTASTSSLTLKAPKRITHDARLKDCADDVKYFLRGRRARSGPSSARCCSSCRRTCARTSQCSTRSWRRCRRGCVRRSSSATNRGSMTEVFARLKARNLALCVADSEKFSTPVEITAGLRILQACATKAISRRTSSAGRR